MAAIVHLSHPPKTDRGLPCINEGKDLIIIDDVGSGQYAAVFKPWHSYLEKLLLVRITRTGSKPQSPNMRKRHFISIHVGLASTIAAHGGS